MSAKQSKPKEREKTGDENERLIAQNRRARHGNELLDTHECGAAWGGSELKTLRDGKVTLDEAYGSVNRGEVWLHNCDIPEYTQANQFNHETKRKRKLLLHRREIEKFASRAFEKGLTLVPLKLYFKRGKAKVLLGICKGRQLHDKREKMKKETMNRDIQRAMRRD